MIPDRNILFEEKRLWGNTKFWGALIFLLSLGFSYMIIMHLAEGGDVTWFSMFFLYLFAYFYGGVQGVIFAVGFGIIKMFGDMFFGLIDTEHMVAEIVDYIVSYGVVGLGGFFSQGLIRDHRKEGKEKKSRDKKAEKNKSEEKKVTKKRGVFIEVSNASDDYKVGAMDEHYALRIGYAMAMLFRFVTSVLNFLIFYYRPENRLISNIWEAIVYCLAYVGVETVLSLLLLLLPWICEAAEYCKYVATHIYNPDLNTY